MYQKTSGCLYLIHISIMYQNTSGCLYLIHISIMYQKTSGCLYLIHSSHIWSISSHINTSLFASHKSIVLLTLTFMFLFLFVWHHLLSLSLTLSLSLSLSSPTLTWRDLQHIVVLTAREANLEADDWVINGKGRQGTVSTVTFFFLFFLRYS